MTRAGNVVALAVGVGLLLSACSGSDAAPAVTAVSIPVVTTTEPSTTTASPTTQGPTTTVDPTIALAAEVEADVLEAFALGRRAWQDPFNADKEKAALDRRLGVIRDDLQTSLAEYRAKNWALRPNTSTPATVTVEGEPRFFGDDQEVAEVQICEVNTWIVVEVGAGPDGSDAIVDPTVLSSRGTVFMRNVAGVWKFEGANQIAEWEGSAECVPE